MSFVSLLLFILFLNVTQIESARILAVFPTPSISHQVVFRKLTEEIVRRGHEVTVITTDPLYSVEKCPPNLKEIDLHNISYNFWYDNIKNGPIGKKDDFYNLINYIMRAISNIVKLQLTTKEVQDIVNKSYGEYDLLLLESWIKPTLIFSNIYNIPVIQVSSYGALQFNWKTVGAVTHSLIYPPLTHRKVYNLTTWEKIEKLYATIVLSHNLEIIEKEDDEALKKKFGPDTPSISSLTNNVHMLFLNQNPMWIDNQPVPSSVIFMGGLHLNPPSKLPKDLQADLDSSKNGVIYFSLGTNINPSNLPKEKIRMLIKAFSALPYDVLWKWDREELPGITSNIKIFKWLPQADLLRHPKIKLFITQGGVQSTDEAIDAGVPLIGLPLLADQWFNVAKYDRHRIGMSFNLHTLTEDELINAIRTIIDNNSYRENIKRLRLLIKDRPQSALERAVWWIEHVLRHNGAAHLRAPGANMTWMEYFEIELLVTVAFVLICILSAIFTIVYLLSKQLSTTRWYTRSRRSPARPCPTGQSHAAKRFVVFRHDVR